MLLFSDALIPLHEMEEAQSHLSKTSQRITQNIVIHHMSQHEFDDIKYDKTRNGWGIVAYEDMDGKHELISMHVHSDSESILTAFIFLERISHILTPREQVNEYKAILEDAYARFHS